MRFRNYLVLLFFTLTTLSFAPSTPLQADRAFDLPYSVLPSYLPVSTGNLLGNIIVPAAGSQNNKQTAVPFSIPVGTPYIIAVIDGEASGYSFRTGTSTTIAATNTDFNQVGPASIQIPLPTNTGVAATCAFYNNGAGGTVKVYASDSIIQDFTIN